MSAAVSRRQVLAGAAVVAATPALAACGSGSEDSAASSDGGVATIDCPCHGSRFSAVDGSVVNGPATKPLPSEQVSVEGEDVTVGGEVLGTTGEVPEGGGTVFADAKIVVTQPTAGEFKAFSAVCTHQGCVVEKVTSA